MNGGADAEITIAALDNDLAVLDALQMLLTLNGYRVRTYSSARSFLDDVHRCTPHCLILEPNLEESGGAAVARELAASYLFVPIVALTAYPDSARTRELADVGVHTMLAKPVASEVLLSQIASALLSQ